MLPLAASLAHLPDAAPALDELLPDEAPEREGTTHYHAPSPNSGRRIYSCLQVAQARWLQWVYRTSRKALRRLLMERTHPLVCGPPQWHRAAADGTHVTPPLPARQATAGGQAVLPLTEGRRQQLWDTYFTSPPSANTLDAEVVELLRAACTATTGDSFPSAVPDVGAGASWSRLIGTKQVGTFRHVQPPRVERKMQCEYGKNLATEPLFKAVRDERNRVLHVGAFLSKLYEAIVGSKPRVVIGGGRRLQLREPVW